ncbi:LPD38 domain-containing protein [Paenibacillus sp. FSL R5-0713]|uniref:LPD38 domain-containing protein n=1 Tax=Paenibacillus sp. FSL R5-0713 TaxID=2921655 RepID=UPI0030DAA6EC
MATRLEQFSEEQRKKAMQIRDSALNGTLNMSQPAAPVNPRTLAVQNYIANQPSMRELQSSLPPALTQVGPNSYLNSTLGRSLAGDPQAQSTIQKSTGISVQPKPLSQYEINKEKIAKDAANNKFIDTFVAPFSNLMNEAAYNNPVGNFITRLGGAAGQVATGTPSMAPGDTGNRAANFTADLLGGAIGSVTNPATIGAPGLGMLSSTNRGSDMLVNSNLGQRAIGKLAQGPAKFMSPDKATKLTTGAVREGIAGGLQGGTGAWARGEDLGGIATDTLLGAGLGAVGDTLLQGAGAGFKALRNRSSSGNLTGALREVGEAAQPGLGVSGLGKNRDPYASAALTDTKSQIRSRSSIELGTPGGLANRAYTALVDDLNPLRQFDRLVEKVMGRSLNASESTHKLALGSRGADMTARQIVTDGLVDSSGNTVGASLKEVLEQLPKGKFTDFEDYLINKHAITRFDRGEKVFKDSLKWTPETGQAKIAQYETQFPEFKQIADELYEFNNNMVEKWLVEPGIISPEQATAWLQANPYYVPNKRFFSELEKTGKQIGGAKGKGFGGKNPVKGYQKGGSQRQIISPIEATIENVDAYVKSANRNKVMQQFVNNIKQAPDDFKQFAEIVEQPEKLDDITKQLLDSDGLEDILSRFSDDFNKAMQNTKLDKDNIVRVLVNGEPVHVKINDKSLLQAVTALGPESGGMLLDAIGWVTNKMKMLTTGANPIFNLTRNVFRDIPQAYVTSKSTGNPLRFIGDLASASLEVMRDGDLYAQFKALGGGHSSAVAANRNLLAQSKRNILPQPALKNAIPKAWNAMENLMNAVETAPRLAEYKRLSKNGQGTKDELLNAIYEAQDLTTNFKRRGTLVRELDKVFPYMNAAIQGMDRFVRMYKDNPVQAGIKSVLAITIPSLVAYAVNHDNPDYQKLSNRIKDQFILIPKGDGTFIRIAKPQELGVLFADIPERLMRKFQDEDPAAFREFSDTLRNNFLPPGVQSLTKKDSNIPDRLLGDTIFGPMTQVAANRNFADAPIVPGYLSRLSPELQSDARTSSLAKWIGEKTGQSPKELDYLMRQYTGVLGQLGLPALSPANEGNNIVQSVGNAFVQNMTADPVYSNDITKEFYNYKDQLDQANVDKELREFPAWYNDDMRKQFNRISKDMGSLRSEMRALEGNTTLDKKQKREQLRTMQQQLNTLAQQGVDLAKGTVPYK